MAAQRPAKIPMGGRRFGSSYGNPPNAITNTDIPPETDGNVDPPDPADPVSPGTNPGAGPSIGGNGMTLKALPGHDMRPNKGANAVWQNPFKGPNAGNETTEEPPAETSEDIYGKMETEAQKSRDEIDPRYDKMSQDLMAMAQQRTAGFERRAESMNVGMGGRLGGAWMGAMRQAGISGAALASREQYNLNLQKQQAYDQALKRLFDAWGQKANALGENERMDIQRGYQIEDRELDYNREIAAEEAKKKAETEDLHRGNVEKWFSGEAGDKDLQWALTHLSQEEQNAMREWMLANEGTTGNEIAAMKAYLTETYGVNMSDIDAYRTGDRAPASDKDGDGVPDWRDRYRDDPSRSK